MSFASSQHVKQKAFPSSIVPVISRTGSPKSGSEVNKVREFNLQILACSKARGWIHSIKENQHVTQSLPILIHQIPNSLDSGCRTFCIGSGFKTSAGCKNFAGIKTR